MDPCHRAAIIKIRQWKDGKDIRGEHHLYQQHGTQILPDSLGFVGGSPLHPWPLSHTHTRPFAEPPTRPSREPRLLAFSSLPEAPTFARAYYPGGGLIIFSHQKLQEMARDGSALDSPVVTASVTLPCLLLRHSPLASFFLEISPDAPIAPSLSSFGPPDLFKRLHHLWRLTPQRRAHD
ncbi:unnamed protein product [Leuciscus chuanchicus]